LVMK